MIPKLATEIVDHILGFLHNDRITLKTCSTVFPQLVDGHLYSHITLRTPKFSSDDTDEAHEDIYWVVQLSEFIPQLEECPERGFCVEGLRIIITVLPAPFRVVSLELLPVITSLLPIFRKIKSIELRVEGTLSWLELGSDFCTAFQNLLRYPAIKKVKISNLDGFPLDSFDDCKSLRDLLLGGQFTNGEVSTSSYPRLSSLSIENQAASDLKKAVSWMKSNTLLTLSLQAHQSVDFRKFHPLIEACSATLVDLDLSVTSHSAHSSMSAETSLGNARFPTLKSLVLRSGAVCLGPGDHSSSLACFVPFLTALSRTSSPQSVHLSIHLQFRVIAMFSLRHEPNVNIEWPDITFFDRLSVFRLPIELHICPRFSLPIRSYLQGSSEIRRMMEDGKLTMIDGLEDFDNDRYIF